MPGLASQHELGPEPIAELALHRIGVTHPLAVVHAHAEPILGVYVSFMFYQAG
jgi:hypothetical protein